MESDKFGIGAGSTLHYVPVLTGKGYFVLRPNYRGSIGYGTAFVRDVVDGYFHQMAPDVLLGVDALIARGLADPDRLVADGMERRRHAGQQADHDDRSLQGRVVGRRHRQLDLAVRRRPTAPSFRRTWFGGTPWQKDAPFELFWNNSPIKDVANVKTPTLFFVGEADTRVPMAQSVEMYRALKSLDVPTQLLIAPREGHQWGALRAPAAQGQHRARVVREVRERPGVRLGEGALVVGRKLSRACQV